MCAPEISLSFSPTVGRGTRVVEAARLLAHRDLPGLIVVDDDGRPVTVLPGTVVQMAVPQYCQDDPGLARVVDEAASDVVAHQLGDAIVTGALPESLRELPIVGDDATVLEIAALMARSRSPLIAVVNDHGVMVGAITLDGLLARVLAP